MRRMLWLALAACVLATQPSCGDGGGGHAGEGDLARQELALDNGGRTVLTGGFPIASGFFDPAKTPVTWLDDVTGDALADVVAVASDGSVRVAIASGDGGFAQPATWLGPSALAGWIGSDRFRRVWLGDTDADGRADIVGNAGDGTLYVARSTGSSFLALAPAGTSYFMWPDWDFYFSSWMRERVYLTDLNGDRRADLFAMGWNGEPSVMLNVNGTFQTSVAYLKDGNPAAPGNMPPALPGQPGTQQGTRPLPPPSDNFAFRYDWGWMRTDERHRWWLAEVTGDEVKDLVGIGGNGDIWVSQGLGDRFANLALWAPQTIFRDGNGWLDPNRAERLWIADVTGDGRDDLVGLAMQGNGTTDGDFWVARSTGSGFVVKRWGGPSFRTADGWFNPGQQQRVFPAEVTGDGRVDLVGVAYDGSVAIARSMPDDTFRTEWVSVSSLTDGSGVFSGGQPRVFAGAITREGVADLVAITSAGDVLFHPVVSALGPVGTRRAPLAAGACALPEEPATQGTGDDLACAGPWQYQADVQPCKALAENQGACGTYVPQWDCSRRLSCEHPKHGVTGWKPPIEFSSEYVYYMPAWGIYDDCHRWAETIYQQNTSPQDRADGAWKFVYEVERWDFPQYTRRSCKVWLAGVPTVPHGQPGRYHNKISDDCPWHSETCNAGTRGRLCRALTHANAPQSECGAAAGTYYTDAAHWGESLNQLKARVPGVKNAVCMTGSSGASEARTQTLLARLKDADALPLRAGEHARFRELLVRRLELLLETRAHELLPTTRNELLDLYTDYPGVASGCGGNYAVPQPDAAACSSALEDLNEKMVLCSRLAFDSDNLAEARAEMYEECLDLGTQLAALEDSPACKRGDYSTRWQQDSNKLTEAILERPLPAAYDPVQGLMQLDAASLADRLRYIDKWYDGRVALAYGGGADRDALWAETADVVSWFWAGIEASPHVDPANPGTIESYTQAALEFDRQVLLAAYATESPLDSAPLVFVTADAFQSFSTRLRDFGLFHDLGCRFKDCRPGGPEPRTDVGQLSLLLGALAEGPTQAGAVAPLTRLIQDTAVVHPSSLRWLAAFQAIEGRHHVLQRAVKDAAGLPQNAAYTPALIEDASASAPRPLVPLRRLVVEAEGRADSFALTGFFTPSLDNTLEIGVQHDLVGQLSNQLLTVLGDLDSEIDNYDGKRTQYLSSLVQLFENIASREGVDHDLRRLLDQNIHLVHDLNGLRVRHAAEEARTAQFAAAYQDVITRPNAQAQKLMEAAGSPPPFTVRPGHARAGASLTEQAVWLDAAGPWKRAADPGDVLNVSVEGAWSPTCRISQPGLSLAPNNASTQLDVPPDAQTGPEGFEVSWNGSEFVADSVTSSFSSGTYGNASVTASVCAGMKAGVGINFIVSVEAYVAVEACLKGELGGRFTNENGGNHQQGAEQRTSASFPRGLRLSGTPLPDMPVGSLVMVQVLRADDGGDRAGKVVDVRVLSRRSTVTVRRPVDVFLVVNDQAGCGARPGGLDVTIAHLEPTSESFAELGRAMVAGVDAIRDQRAALVAQGRLLAEDRASLRADAYAVLNDACPTCLFEAYPATVKGFFEQQISHEIGRVEREVEMVGLERQIRAVELELKGLRDRSIRHEKSHALLSLLPEWTLQGMQKNKLRKRVGQALELMNTRLYPVLDIRYPSLLGSMKRELRPHVNALTSADWAGSAMEHAELAYTVLDEFKMRWVASVSTAKNPQIRDVAISFPNPAFALPSQEECESGDFDPTLDPGTLPCIDETHVFRANPARAAATWRAARSLDPEERRQVPFAIELTDLYHAPAQENTLGCTSGIPVIKGMALYFMMPNTTGSATFNTNSNYAESFALPDLVFPNAFGAERYRMKVPDDASQPDLTRDWTTADVKLLMGKVGQTMTVFKPFADNAAAQLRGFEGISPFTGFFLDLRGRESILAQARELVLVLRTEYQTVAPAMNWIETCN